MDRSDPKSNMVCPATKSTRVWKDKPDSSEKRVFKCTSSTNNSSAQTESCHISMLAPANTNTSGWNANKTTTLTDACKGTWYKY
jgi:hypothetical protein